MVNPESPDTPEIGYDVGEAEKFCEEFNRLISEFKALINSQTATESDWNRVTEAASLLVQHSLYDNLNFRLLVTIPEGVEAKKSINFDFFEENVREYNARHITFIGMNNDRFEVDFSEKRQGDLSGHYLTVFDSFDFQIRPIPLNYADQEV